MSESNSGILPPFPPWSKKEEPKPKRTYTILWSGQCSWEAESYEKALEEFKKANDKGIMAHLSFFSNGSGRP